MADTQTSSRGAAPRGRGSARGGRGGFAGGRGGRPARTTNGDKDSHKLDTDTTLAFEDEPELAQLRKQYGSKTGLIKEMFPDWSEVDILFALQETDGDETVTVTRIADGSISRWGEVSKPKKAPRAKPKDAAPATASHDTGRPARGGRAVSDGARGRGRGADRGPRGTRGRASAAQPATNGHRAKEPLSVPTEESSAWDVDTSNTAGAAWADADASESAPAAQPEPPKPKVAAPAPVPQKTWASMLRQSTAPKPAPKPKEPPVPKPAPEAVEPLPPVEPPAPEPEPEPVVEEPEEEPVEEPEPVEIPTVIEPEIALPPSKDQLTEKNLDQVIDVSTSHPTGTAASTAADSWDPRQNAGSTTATPISASQQQHQTPRTAAATVAPASTGYAASAIKATAERRTPNFRRKLDQEEAVRMPGNREVDRAAIQFGNFTLNGLDDDIDGDREEPETRAQPPDDSPIAHPRTSLPPVSQPAPVPEAAPAPKPAATLPTPPVPAAVPTGPAAQTQAPTQTQPIPQSNQQYGRFGQAPSSQESSSYGQKPFDSFNQQASTSAPSQFDNFSAQQPQQAQAQQQPGGAFSSAPGDYSNYYTAGAQDRGSFNNYYGQQYGQQGQGAQSQQSQDSQTTQSQQPQQRPFGGYNSTQTDNLSQYPQSGLHNQSRYGAVSNDAQNSGHTTPNPSAQPQPAQGAQPPSHGQQPHQNYQYNHPYYNNPYYANYIYGTQGGYNQGGYGAGPYGKAGMYGQPYGMSGQGPYDHNSSQGSGFGQTSLHRGNSDLSSGLGDFGRSTSSQTGNQQGMGAGGFGGAGMHDAFSRGGASGFQSQSSQGFSNQSQPGASDDLKPFGETKTGAGPSPSIGGARPGSATQNAPTGQAGLPPQQSGQMGGYGGYPNHLQGGSLHGSGYGMGGSGAGGQHGSTPYSYGQGGFNSGGYYGGGQGNQQQPRGGWGGNYH